MSETLWAVLLGGAIAAFTPLITAILNSKKWREEQQFAETQAKRETLAAAETYVYQTTIELLTVLSELRRTFVGDLGKGDTGVSSNERLSLKAHADLLGKNYSWEVAIDLYLSNEERQRVKSLRDRFSVHETEIKSDFAPLVDEVLNITRLARERIRAEAWPLISKPYAD